MSGLAVILGRDDRPIGRAEVIAMLAAAPYRGPDGFAARAWGNLALGHARLVTTPEEHDEDQPLVSPRTGCAIVADARLDNRDELLAGLDPRPAPTIGDAELILRRYELEGDRAIPRLLGDFAFALWDPRDRRLVCARDTSGQRSLFYRLDRRTFAAASEIQQLFQDPAVPIAPNEGRIRDYLVRINMDRNTADAAETFYEGIRALPAGHVLVVRGERAEVRRYWELPRQPELRYRDERAYAEHFRALFFEAVRARLRTAGPAGALLSGGLDSSSVVCTVQELHRVGGAGGAGLTAYSLLFGDLECDETGFIREIEAKYDLKTRYVQVAGLVSSLDLDPREFLPGPGKATGELDAAFRAASRDGVRVVLSGEMADSCVGGSRLTFDSLLRHARFGALWRHLATYHRLSGESWRKILAVYGLAPFLPPAALRQAMVMYTRRVVERDWKYLHPRWLRPELRAELDERHLALALAAERARRFASPARESEYRQMYPPEVGVRTAGWPLQLWRPFADRRLHAFLLAIPPEQKFEPHPATDEYYAGAKQIVRRGMQGILPESVRRRTEKTHFASLLQDEFVRRWANYEAAFGPNGRSEVVERGYVDRERFWERLNLIRSGIWPPDFLYVMRMLGVETWLRTFGLPRAQLARVPARFVEGAALPAGSGSDPAPV